jgi:hypothetical protein
VTTPDQAPAWLSTPPPASKPASRRRWVIGCLGLIVVFVIAAVLGISMLSRALGNGFAVMSASNGSIDSFNAVSNGSRMTITFQAARGLDLADGPALACEVVRPALATTDWADASWIVVNRAGDTIASNETPCP